jgi:uncharacterized protein (DUF58 family)
LERAYNKATFCLKIKFNNKKNKVMKRLLAVFIFAFALLFNTTTTYAEIASNKELARVERQLKKNYKNDPRIEIVNETTVIFHNVVKIEIKNKSNRANEQVTYIYDMKNSALIKVARGSFEVELPMGKYLVQSNKKITKMDYEIIIE